MVLKKLASVKTSFQFSLLIRSIQRSLQSQSHCCVRGDAATEEEDSAQSVFLDSEWESLFLDVKGMEPLLRTGSDGTPTYPATTANNLCMFS